jgi:hypothetical protein
VTYPRPSARLMNFEGTATYIKLQPIHADAQDHCHVAHSIEAVDSLSSSSYSFWGTWSNFRLFNDLGRDYGFLCSAHAQNVHVGP